jgi:site-specific recombinase XerD
MTLAKVNFYPPKTKGKRGVSSGHPSPTLFHFMEQLIQQFYSLGKIRTSETYSSSMNSFKRFRKGVDIAFNELDSDLVLSYEAFLKQRGVNMNTSSFYMRTLRAVYNRAVEKGWAIQQYPFKHVYTGVDKTVKRAISLRTIRRIKMLDLSSEPKLEFARDMFLFSFYTRGMSFIDMAYLKKRDLNRGVLAYRRRKTGQQLFIKWEQVMQDIVKKYEIEHSVFLLPIIRTGMSTERNQYLAAAHTVNRCLKDIGELIGLSLPLTTYVARHAWASIAKSKNIPLSVISEGMGHDSEKTTRIYLASLDSVAIDRANHLILKSL